MPFTDLGKPPETSFFCCLSHGADFVKTHRTIDLRIPHMTPFLFPYMSSRIVLLHDMDVQVPANVLREPAHNLYPLFFMTGHHQMPK